MFKTSVCHFSWPSSHGVSQHCCTKLQSVGDIPGCTIPFYHPSLWLGLTTCIYPPTPAFAKAGAAPGTTAGVELFRAHSPLSLGHSRQLPPRPLAGSLCCSRVAACPLPAHPSRQLPPSPLAVSVPALQPALCLH